MKDNLSRESQLEQEDVFAPQPRHQPAATPVLPQNNNPVPAPFSEQKEGIPVQPVPKKIQATCTRRNGYDNRTSLTVYTPKEEIHTYSNAESLISNQLYDLFNCLFLAPLPSRILKERVHQQQFLRATDAVFGGILPEYIVRHCLCPADNEVELIAPKIAMTEKNISHHFELIKGKTLELMRKEVRETGKGGGNPLEGYNLPLCQIIADQSKNQPESKQKSDPIIILGEDGQPCELSFMRRVKLGNSVYYPFGAPDDPLVADLFMRFMAGPNTPSLYVTLLTPEEAEGSNYHYLGVWSKSSKESKGADQCVEKPISIGGIQGVITTTTLRTGSSQEKPVTHIAVYDFRDDMPYPQNKAKALYTLMSQHGGEKGCAIGCLRGLTRTPTVTMGYHITVNPESAPGIVSTYASQSPVRFVNDHHGNGLDNFTQIMQCSAEILIGGVTPLESKHIAVASVALQAPSAPVSPSSSRGGGESQGSGVVAEVKAQEPVSEQRQVGSHLSQALGASVTTPPPPSHQERLGIRRDRSFREQERLRREQPEGILL